MKNLFLLCLGVLGFLSYADAKTPVVSESAYEISFGGRGLFEMHSALDQKNKKTSFTLSDPDDDLTHDQRFLFSASRCNLLTSIKTKVGAATDVSGNLKFAADPYGRPVQECFVRISNSTLGTLSLGDCKGADDKSICSPSDIVLGSGGTDGTQMKVVNRTTGVIMGPDLTGGTREATKVFYCTPRIKGLQLSAQYVPNVGHYGEASTETYYKKHRQSKLFEVCDVNSRAFGANYLVDVAGTTLNLSFVKLNAKTKPERLEIPMLERVNTNVYDLGLLVKSGPMSFAVEYIHNGDSHKIKNKIDSFTPMTEANYPAKSYDPDKAGGHIVMNFGITYSNDLFGLSFSHLRSRMKTGFCLPTETKSTVAKGRAYVFGIERFVAPGFSVYSEFGIYNMKNSDAPYIATVWSKATDTSAPDAPPHAEKATFVSDNKAKVITVGIKLQF